MLMALSQLSRRRVLAGMGASGVVAAAPVSDALAERRPTRFVPPPMGTTWTYRTHKDETETWVREEDGGWETRIVLNYRRTAPDALDGEEIQSFVRLNGNWITTRTANGDPMFSADPDDRRFRWPMTVGGAWRSRFSVLDHRSGQRHTAEAQWVIEAIQFVPTPRGELPAFKLVTFTGGNRRVIWFSPHLGVEIRDATFANRKILADRRLRTYEVPES